MERNIMKLFIGNCPKSVCKAAKYHIRREKGNFVVGINYDTSDGEYWTPTTKEHHDLVEMVKAVKEQVGGQPGGAFYINEFREVIVPAGDKYYLAGEYKNSLEFIIQDEDGNDVLITGKAVDWKGNPLKIGDEWKGYLMGIPYILNPQGTDIRYEKELGPNHFRRILLSKVTSVQDAKTLAHRLSRIIDNNLGGRFYINDEREMFKPVNRDNGLVYIYLGRLADDDPWFPKTLFEKEE